MIIILISTRSFISSLLGLVVKDDQYDKGKKRLYLFICTFTKLKGGVFWSNYSLLTGPEKLQHVSLFCKHSSLVWFRYRSFFSSVSQRAFGIFEKIFVHILLFNFRNERNFFGYLVLIEPPYPVEKSCSAR